MNATHNRISLFMAVAASILLPLSGCGGEDEDPDPSQGTHAAGAFTGTVSSGTLFRSVTLPNREVWIFEGREIDGTFWFGDWHQATLLEQGQSPATQNAVIVGELAQLPASLSLSATTSSIMGTISSPEFGIDRRFEGTPNTSSTSSWLYRFDANASTESIQGTWGMPSGRRSIGMTLQIAPNGDFTGTGSFGGLAHPSCDISGKLTPNRSGKNFFDVSLSSFDQSCFAITAITAGFAVTYPLGNGQSELILSFVGSNPTRSRTAWRMVARR
jgi:hypothetical protein